MLLPSLEIPRHSQGRHFPTCTPGARQSGTAGSTKPKRLASRNSRSATWRNGGTMQAKGSTVVHGTVRRLLPSHVACVRLRCPPDDLGHYDRLGSRRVSYACLRASLSSTPENLCFFPHPRQWRLTLREKNARQGSFGELSRHASFVAPSMDGAAVPCVASCPPNK